MSVFLKLLATLLLLLTGALYMTAVRESGSKSAALAAALNIFAAGIWFALLIKEFAEK